MLLHLHHVPGRLRFQMAGIKRNRIAGEALRERLLALPGVTSVSLSHAIGSVTLRYGPDFDHGALWAHLSWLGHHVEKRKTPIAVPGDPLVRMASDMIAKALVEAFLQRLLGPAGFVFARLLA